ncbi:metallophosphoesterase [Candidatus Sulfidibacterium hydrothermale]|uniref:metallophosphoesterase n=1 Tax=Candidatus Sulfidibacterium hydrothermale TaxID=2875962 RepID=UPI001F0B6ECD|nr:metallophosphoesterase [Candidatus Sulfidibacterium hydrothermale]UBM61557.1 metallophosphoesterase [Candidatus Sulfidibacterium hydrothermale]
MILQYASDLHLEFPENKEYIKQNPLKPLGEILVLAGDIVPFAAMNQQRDFFDFVSKNFKYTFWVPGNHEYYHFDVKNKCGTFHEKIRDNVFLVNNTTVIHEDVKFIFSTLWSKIRPVYQWQIERGMSDFHVIKYAGHRFSAERFNELHDESLQFIEQELNKKHSGKTVIVTHHVPTFLNYPEDYKNSILNDAFAVELFDLIDAKGPNYWIYGHNHHNPADFTIGKTKLLTNQLGYVKYNEHSAFNSTKNIKIA